MQTNLLFFFIHHIWEERVLWGAVFIIQTSYNMQYFTIFQRKLHSFNIQDHRSTRGLLISETVQKFPKSPIRPAGSNFWQAPNLRRNLNRVTLQRYREFIESNFINGFITMCNLKKRLIRLASLVLLQAMFMNGWKQTAKRWKLHFWDYQQSIKKYDSVEHIQRQEFSFTKTNEYLSVSKNPQVFTSKHKD